MLTVRAQDLGAITKELAGTLDTETRERLLVSTGRKMQRAVYTETNKFAREGRLRDSFQLRVEPRRFRAYVETTPKSSKGQLATYKTGKRKGQSYTSYAQTRADYYATVQDIGGVITPKFRKRKQRQFMRIPAKGYTTKQLKGMRKDLWVSWKTGEAGTVHNKALGDIVVAILRRSVKIRGHGYLVKSRNRALQLFARIVHRELGTSIDRRLGRATQAIADKAGIVGKGSSK